MIKKILPSFFLASALIINHGYAMEIDDSSSDKIQIFISKMHPTLLEIYQKPKDQRKAYIAQVCTDPEEKDREDIYNCIEEIQSEIPLDYFGIKINLVSLNRTKESKISLMNGNSEKLQDAIKAKNKQEQSMHQFLVEAENHACLFADPTSSAEQVDQVKKAFTKYLEDKYNLSNIDTKTRMLQTTIHIEEQQKQEYAVYELFLSNLCTILKKVDKFSLNGNNAIREINKFQLQYYRVQKENETALWQCNFYQGNVNKEQNELLGIQNKIRTLETPLFLFLEDLQSISNLL